MFCNETIKEVYIGYEEDDVYDHDAFFDFFHELAYYCTEGYRIVLVTDNYAISLCSRGVIKERKEDFQEAEGEWLQDGIERIRNDELPWVRYETTLFVGERVLSVVEKDRKYVVEFDDFILNIVPCITDDEITGLRNKDQWSYNYVLGCDRHLKRNCPHCHGEGEILLDFVSDFVVRCKNCKQSTYRQMMLIDAINEWNDGHVECDLSDITIE